MLGAAPTRSGSAASAAAPRPSIGSLFVPTRIVTGPRGTLSPCYATAPQQQHAVEDFPSPPWVQAVALEAAPAAPVAEPPAAAAVPREAAPLVCTTDAAPAKKPPLHFSWAGSGIYFWWQLGAVQYLAERFDLSRTTHTGASGGGLAAVLATCGVSASKVVEAAYDLSVAHNIWERPLGLMGCWGGLIEHWLGSILPRDAHRRCDGQVEIILTQLPRCNQVAISEFESKEDLINVAMASAHVPIFLDWKVSRECRGVQCMDGSVPDFFAGNCELLVRGGNAVLFDYFEDPALVRNGRMDMLKLRGYEEIKEIMRTGYKYARKLHNSGAFSRFDTEGIAYGRVRRHALADPAAASPPGVLLVPNGSAAAAVAAAAAEAQGAAAAAVLQSGAQASMGARRNGRAVGPRVSPAMS